MMLSIIILSALLFQVGSSFEVQGGAPPNWQQYRVDQIYRGKTATPFFTTKEEREFQTQIRRQAAKGPNFASQYTVVLWGCGTECAEFVIVDARSGRIFFHAQREDASTLYYKLDSRLIVTDNSCPDTEPNTCHRSFWEADCLYVCFRLDRGGHAVKIKGFRKAWYRGCMRCGLGKMEPVVDLATGQPVYEKPCGLRSKAKVKTVYVGRLFHDLRRSGVRNLVRAA